MRKYKEYLEEAGFVDVVEKKYTWPVGTWAKGKREKMLGLWYREDLLSGLQGFTMALLTRALGMLTAEVEVLLAGVRDDIKSNKIHIYIPVQVSFGIHDESSANFVQTSCIWPETALKSKMDGILDEIWIIRF